MKKGLDVQSRVFEGMYIVQFKAVSATALHYIDCSWMTSVRDMYEGKNDTAFCVLIVSQDNWRSWQKAKKLQNIKVDLLHFCMLCCIPVLSFYCGENHEMIVCTHVCFYVFRVHS